MQDAQTHRHPFPAITKPHILCLMRIGCNANAVFSSRPGILALINDADWELEGEEAYEVQSGDNILFVSTLHGG